MATLVFDERFEGGLGSYTSQGSPSTSTGASLDPSGGSNGLLITGSGAQNIRRDPSASKTVVVDRFYVRMPVGGTPATASATLWNLIANALNFQIRVNTSGTLQAIVGGGTARSFGALTPGQTYCIDVKATCSGTTYTLDWQVDGVAQTQATVASTASTFGVRRLGNITAGVTAETFHLDAWASSETSGDYPLGPLSAPPQTQGIGTPPDGHATYGPATLATTPFTIFNEDFSGDLSAYTTGGTAPTIETAPLVGGEHSLKVTAAGSSYAQRATADAPTTETARFVYKHVAHPSGAIGVIYSLVLATGSVIQVRVSTGGQLQTNFTAIGQSKAGPTLVAGHEYLIDLKVDVSTGTWTIDCEVNGTPIAGGQNSYAAGSATTISSERWGNTVAGATCNFRLTGIRITRELAAYPLGWDGVELDHQYLDLPAVASTAVAHGPIVGYHLPSFDERFENGLGDWTQTGTPTLDSSDPVEDLASLHIAGTGAEYISRDSPAGQEHAVLRFQYEHLSNPVGGTATLVDLTTVAGKNGSIRVTTAGLLQAGITGGGTFVNGPTLLIGHTYLIEAHLDISASTFSLVWQVDGSAQSTASYAVGAASTMDKIRVGQLNTGPTYDYQIDSVGVSYAVEDYPLGPPQALAASGKLFIGTPPDGHATYAPTLGYKLTNLIQDERFELKTSLNAYAQTGSNFQRVVQAGALEGIAQIRFQGTGISYISKSVDHTHKVIAVRLLYRHGAHPTTTATVLDITTDDNKNGSIRVTAAGKFQWGISGGGTFNTFPFVLTPGQDYVLDVLLDSGNDIFKLDFSVDGSAYPRATYDTGIVGGSGAQRVRLGQLNPSPTYDYSVDAWAISYTRTDYPIGAPDFQPPSPQTLDPGALVSVRLSEPGDRGAYWLNGDLSTGDTLDQGLQGQIIDDLQGDTILYWHNDVEQSRGTFDWGRLRATALAAKQQGKKIRVRLLLGQHCAPHVYTTVGGNVPFVQLYDGTAATTKNIKLPLFWTPEWRNEHNRIATALNAALQQNLTDGSGEKVADYVHSVPLSICTDAGSEMWLQYQADTVRNRPLWDAVTPSDGYPNPELARRALVLQAWKDGIDDWLSIFGNNVSLSVALGGWFSDGQAGAWDICKTKFPNPRLIGMHTNFCVDYNGDLPRGQWLITGGWRDAQPTCARNLDTIRARGGRIGLQQASWSGGPNEYVSFADPQAAFRAAMVDLAANWRDAEYFEFGGSLAPWNNSTTRASILSAMQELVNYSSGQGDDGFPGPMLSFGVDQDQDMGTVDGHDSYGPTLAGSTATHLTVGRPTGSHIYAPTLSGGDPVVVIEEGTMPDPHAAYGPVRLWPDIAPLPVGGIDPLYEPYAPMVRLRPVPDHTVVVECYTGSVTVHITGGQGGG